MSKLYVKEMPSNWGGSRPGAGREKVKDKKKQVYIMIRESEVDLLGGQNEVKRVMEQSVQRAIRKKRATQSG